MRQLKYQETISQITKKVERLVFKSKILLWTKLLFFIFSIYSLYKSISLNLDTTWLIGGVLALIIYLASLFIDSLLQKKITFKRNQLEVLENEISYCNRIYKSFDCGEEFIDPKHPYTFDLDIFGVNSFFNRINRTVSLVGKKRLAYYLKKIDISVVSISRRQMAIKEIATKFDWRISFLSFGIDKEYDLEHLLTKLHSQKAPHSFFLKQQFYALLILSIIITSITIIACIYDLLPSSYGFVLFFLQLFISSLFAKKVTAVGEEIAGLNKGFKQFLGLINHIYQERFESDLPLELQNKLKVSVDIDVRHAFRELNSILSRFDQRGNFLTYTLFNGLYYQDLWTVKRFMDWKKKYTPYMSAWIDIIGEFDVLVSLGTYAYNHPENCEVELLENSTPVLDGIGLYHPFINKDIVISNDFKLDSNTLAIITGANMAGKSTFLRAIGVNFVMALNGLPVCAQSLSVTPMQLFSSMRTSDNLVENISYFNAELIRIENLIDYCEENEHTLIILDEILKGTNSKDKLKGSMILLEELTKLRVSGVIATHDLELTKLGESSNKYYNYCFEIELGEEINYSYKIERGVAQNLNATYLLNKILKKRSKVKRETN